MFHFYRNAVNSLKFGGKADMLRYAHHDAAWEWKLLARTQKASRPDQPPMRKPGVREKQKAQRFARIKLAARALFLKNEYERTTLRAIGRQARVGAGTILRYVPDKRALLLLLFDEDHKAVSDRAAAELSESKDFLRQSMDGFRHYYRYFGAYPEYARAILRESSFYNPWKDDAAEHRAGARSIERIKQTVRIARSRGEITIDESDETLARLIFEIYQIECRHWLADAEPNVDEGLMQLRRTLEVLLRGLR
jgi:AcrR family transcriptional regulator